MPVSQEATEKALVEGMPHGDGKGGALTTLLAQQPTSLEREDSPLRAALGSTAEIVPNCHHRPPKNHAGDERVRGSQDADPPVCGVCGVWAGWGGGEVGVRADGWDGVVLRGGRAGRELQLERCDAGEGSMFSRLGL